MSRKERKTTVDPKLEGVSKKIAKILSEDLEWLEKVPQMSKEDIDKEIVRCSEVIADTVKDMEADTHLNELKEQKKEVELNYKAGIKINQARVSYLIGTKRSL